MKNIDVLISCFHFSFLNIKCAFFSKKKKILLDLIQKFQKKNHQDNNEAC